MHLLPGWIFRYSPNGIHSKILRFVIFACTGSLKLATDFYFVYNRGYEQGDKQIDFLKPDHFFRDWQN